MKIILLIGIIAGLMSCNPNRPLVYVPTGVIYEKYNAIEPGHRYVWVRIDSAGKINKAKARKKAVIFEKQATTFNEKQ